MVGDKLRWLGVVALALALACGGKSTREPDPGGDGDPEPSEPAGGDGQPSSDPEWDGGTALGSCEHGFDRFDQPERSCNWQVSELCYEDKLEACACACPAGTDISNCYSGWPVEDGAVEVYCF